MSRVVYRECPDCESERLKVHESASYFVRWVECSGCGWRSPLDKFKETPYKEAP